MYRYSNEGMTFTGILNRAVRLHYLTLKYTILPILLITVVKYVALLCSEFFLNPVAQIVINLASTVLIFCLFVFALLATHLGFTEQSQSMMVTFKAIISRWLTIFATAIAYLAGGYLLYQLLYLLIFMINKHFSIHSPIHGATMIISAVFLIMYIAMFSFCVPLCVLDDTTVWKSFRDSIILTEKNRYGVLMLFLLLGAIFLLVSPASIHEYLLSTYHLSVLFDFVVFCVVVPLLINLLLLLINDSKQKAAVELS